ncbi:MAG: hypothetical protein ABW223_00555 [Rariglobus sp.]
MNDRRFIELLNLYLDQHISPEEAAELETAILRNPARRRTYDQYCQLQRGCSLLGEHSRASAPASHGFARSLRDAERKIAAPRCAVIWRPVYIGSFAGAMAACVAVVFIINRQPSLQPLGVEQFADAGQVAPVPVAIAAVPEAVTPARIQQFEFQPVLASSGLGAVRNSREAEIAANDREALEWMQRVDLLPIHNVVVDDQTFESRATLQPDNRVFRSRHSLRGNAEFTAFQFQR